VLVQYEHGVVGVASAYQVREREVLCSQVQLELMREGYLCLLGASLGAALEQEGTFLGLDDHLRRAAGTGGKLSDTLDDTKVVVTQAGCQEFGVKCRMFFCHSAICLRPLQQAI